MVVSWHYNGMFNFIWRCTVSKAAANPEKTFSIEEWIQFVQVTCAFDLQVPFVCTLSILELALITFKIAQGLDFGLKVLTLCCSNNGPFSSSFTVGIEATLTEITVSSSRGIEIGLSGATLDLAMRKLT